MKRLILFFSFFVGLQSWGQVDTLNPLTQKQIADSMYRNLDSYVPTGKLYNRLLLDDTLSSVCWNSRDIGQPGGALHSNADFFYGVMYELQMMSVDTSTIPSQMELFDPVFSYMGEIEFDLDRYYYPVGIADFDYNYADIDANIQQGKLTDNDDVIEINSGSPVIETRKAQLIGPLSDLYDSDVMGIIFKPENFYSNRKSVDDILKISLTHNGVTSVLDWDEPYEFVPAKDSIQLFTARVTYSDSTYIENTFFIQTPEIYVKAKSKSDDDDFPGCTYLPLNGLTEIEQDGHKLKWCWIPRCGSDGRLFKPYILLTGYRPPFIGQSFKKTWTIYNPEHQFLLTSLIDNNYDILLVKFNIHAKPYSHGMQQSAALLEDFILLVNEAKGGQSSGQENVIQGSSMSADIASLTLLRMEKKHAENSTYPHHHTRLFIAYDGNFFGANLPLAYQYQIYSHFKHPTNFLFGLPYYVSPKYFLSTYLFSTEQQKTVKELLMYHAAAQDDDIFSSANYQQTFTPTHHWRRQEYYDALTAVDNGVHIFPMPLACRNIAISLGKISGTDNEGDETFHDPGQYWRDIDIGFWKFKIRASKYTSGTENTELFWRKKTGLSWNSLYVNHRIHVNQMQEIDMASGSYLEGSGNLIQIANIAYFFVPNLFDGKDNFSHKSVITALGINKTLWPTNGSLTLNIQDLQLMFNNYSDLANNIQSEYFGYPNLGRPNDHFQVTPFEAIYVDRNINPHIRFKEAKDAVDLPFLNDFIRNEVEPWYLGLQNTNLGSKARTDYTYYSYRRARYQIVVGHLVTPTTDPGDYVVEANGKLVLKSKEIDLQPGVHFKAGSNINIVPEYEVCSNSKSMKTNETVEENTSQNALDNFNSNEPEKVGSGYSIYPNPTSGKLTITNLEKEEIRSVFIYNLAGEKQLEMLCHSVSVEMELGNLKNGVYLVELNTLNSKKSLNKLIIQ